ncbi:MAG: T9SS type A sorting domain-containing protein [Ignavibacteria bacterium]
MQKLILIFLLFFTIILNAQPVTVTFQQGVNGYTGTRSVNISDLNLVAGNNGTTFADGNNDWCIGKLHARPGFGYDISPLLRFENLNIPVNAIIISATLTLTHVMWEVPSSRVKGRYMNVDWTGIVIDSNGGVGNAPVGWERRMPGTPWSSPGGTGEGTDLIAGKYFYSPPDSSIMPSNGEVTYNIPLDLAVVQNWISNPVSNHGVKLQVDASSVHIYYRPPQRPDVPKRPKLSITYTIPTGINNTNGIPSSYFLEQNYPNPFNPVTSINFGLPEGDDVKLSIYNALGMEVEILCNGYKSAGNHYVIFNAENYSSGIYFYKLISGEFSGTKKMSIIK